MSSETPSYHTLTTGQKTYAVVKRIADFLIALAALLILALPLVILAIIIKIDDPGPVFFRQKRIGKNQRCFMMLKFRTMRTDAPKDMPTHLLKNPEQCITRAGRILRKTSLDELPQLLNILFGQMSIVGPRPALWNQDDLNAARESLGVHQIRPGLTGWAQINGRDELEIPVKAALDGEYLQKFGLWMDIRCFFGTFLAVLGSKGVVEGGTGTLHSSDDSVSEEATSK